MDELDAAAGVLAVSLDDFAEGDFEQRQPYGLNEGSDAATSMVNDEEQDKENIRVDAARPRVEDASCKVSTPPFVPCSQPYAQHLAPLDSHTIQPCTVRLTGSGGLAAPEGRRNVHGGHGPPEGFRTGRACRRHDQRAARERVGRHQEAVDAAQL